MINRSAGFVELLLSRALQVRYDTIDICRYQLQYKRTLYNLRIFAENPTLTVCDDPGGKSVDL